MLRQAHYLGETYGRLMVDHTARAAYEEGTMILRDIGIGRFLSRAKEIVSGIVGRIRDIVSGIFSKGGTTEEAEEAVDNLLDYLPESVSETEIHTEVELAVMDVFEEQNVEQIECVCQPDACELCLANQDAGPIDRGSEFPSGHVSAPFHYCCKCITIPVIADQGS